MITGFEFPQVRKTSSFVFWNRTRIYVMVLTLICLTFMQMNTLTLNFTVICMDDIVEDFHMFHNSTETHWFERSTEKSLLFSGVAIGGLIGLVPSVPQISSIGLRNTQTISGFISGLGSFLFPLAVSVGFYTSFLCRVLQGIGAAVLFTAVGVVPGVWAPKSEANTFMSILACAFQLSNVICMPVSGLLCESAVGWRSIYYISGAITFVLYTVFWFTYTDDPKLHRNVSQKELRKISTGKVEKIKEPVPYFAVSTDPTVIISWISLFGGNMGFYVLCIYGPTYLREVLKFDVKETGFLTALPFILSAIAKFSAGRISDKLTGLSERARFVFFASIFQIGLVAGLVVMAFTTNRVIAQIAFNFAIVSSGLNIMGVVKCVQLRCLQHVHYTLTVMSFTAYASQFLSPTLVSIICPNYTNEQWKTFFLVISGLIVACNAGFPFLARSDAAGYTKKQEPTVKC
ncbi:Major facilitator superfamily (MFS) profile domain-containing protein [Caenorhabditis elegans]|nr:Major facilitator superfamily (MFS) profile domain-containing protein [Caenorhabditis elegans]CUR30066.1 Major facilitator superfamily (MFS) profile domain-containing protein [Caenorhabditis elegans]|eukprot:NP_001303767.1 Uncharacterized protein CELE_Y19D10A.8 [Caenorhabditis elegans]